MRKIILFSLTIFSYLSVNAQNILNSKSPEDILKKEMKEALGESNKPLPYEHVNDRDIMWSRTVWETVDLKERINLPYYYPTDTLNASRGRKSLYDALIGGIESGRIKKVYSGSYFKQSLIKGEIMSNMERVDTTDLGVEQMNSGESISSEYIDKIRIQTQDVKMFKIRGMWYFDKKVGELKYRLLGIAPVAPDVYQEEGTEDADLVELFWVWYPDARDELHKYKVFNPKNASTPFSFDDLLNARRFSANIYKVENEYGDREIKDYYKDSATKQILEAMKQKEAIRDFETNQWSN